MDTTVLQTYVGADLWDLIDYLTQGPRADTLGWDKDGLPYNQGKAQRADFYDKTSNILMENPVLQTSANPDYSQHTKG